MIPRNLLLFIIMAISAVSSTSNIDCVIDAFDKERQQLGQDQAARLAVQAAANSKPSAAPGEKPSKYSLNWTQWTKDKINTIIGGSDSRIDPISYSVLNAKFLQSNIDFISAEGRHWVQQQCMPYVDIILKDTPRSVFLCTKLYRLDAEDVRVLESIKGFAFHTIGRMLKDVAAHSKPEKEIKLGQTVVLQSELTSANIQISTFYRNLEANFRKEFKKSFTTTMDYLENDSNMCNLEPKLRVSMSKNIPQIKTVLRAVYAILVSQKITVSTSTCQLIQNVLADYPHLLHESPTSPAFAKLGDLIIGRIHNNKSIKSLESNVFFPMCISAIVESGSHSSVKELSACKSTFQETMDLPFGDSHFAVDVFESPQIISLLKNTLAEAVGQVRNSQSGDFSKLPANVKIIWSNVLATSFLTLDNLESFQKKAGLNSSIFTPLIYSLEDILGTEGVKPKDILTDQFLKGVKDVTAGTVFSATPVTDFLETYKTNIIDSLSEHGEKIKENQFRQKLVQKCRLMPNSVYKHTCIYISQDINVSKLLHYRFLDAVFDLIVDRISDRLAKVNTASSDTLVIGQMALESVKNLLIEFDEELARLTELKPDLVSSHTPTKALIYLLVSKTVFMDSVGLLPSPAYEYLTDYVNKHAESLKSLKIRHFEFSRLMNGLQSHVASQSAQINGQIDGIKGGQIKEMDSDIKEFGLTTAEKGEIRKHLPQIFRNFNQLSVSLKSKLQLCQFKDDVLQKALEACESRNKVQCTYVNPFLLMVPCSPGFTADQRGHCVASCPDAFTSFDLRFCKKPLVSLVELRAVGAQKEYKCPPGFIQEGILCVPRCPIGWKSFGDMCERPVKSFDYSTEVILVK